MESFQRMHKRANLIELMRDEFAVSKQWLRISILCNVVVLMCNVIDSAASLQNIHQFVPIFSLIIQVVAFFVREKSFRDFSFAEEIRRLALFQDGLCLKISPLQLARFGARVGKHRSEEPPYIDAYYTSTLEPGSKRLLTVLTESCFYTQHISNHAFRVLSRILLGCFLGIGALILFMINASVEYDLLSMLTHASLPIFSFWATGDVLFMTLKFWDLQKQCTLILDKCEQFEKNNLHSLSEIMILVDEYNCALASSMPLPTKYYLASTADLNLHWSRRSVG